MLPTIGITAFELYSWLVPEQKNICNAVNFSAAINWKEGQCLRDSDSHNLSSGLHCGRVLQQDFISIVEKPIDAIYNSENWWQRQDSKYLWKYDEAQRWIYLLWIEPSLDDSGSIYTLQKFCERKGVCRCLWNIEKNKFHGFLGSFYNIWKTANWKNPDTLTTWYYPIQHVSDAVYRWNGKNIMRLFMMWRISGKHQVRVHCRRR